MKKLIFIVALFLVGVDSYAQQEITTFILLRHAEKENDGTKDPDITDEGRQRAIALARLLSEVKVDAIYSTNFKRTQHTLAPLAKSKNLTLLSYEPMKADEIDQMIKKFPGGTIVVCGHSNTTPWIANYLTGKETYKDFNENDYDNILFIDVAEKGKKAKVLWLNY
jgi:2,3-bisphosphoglycerate-dependent phosphoglycerate mutase